MNANVNAALIELEEQCIELAKKIMDKEKAPSAEMLGAAKLAAEIAINIEELNLRANYGTRLQSYGGSFQGLPSKPKPKEN